MLLDCSIRTRAAPSRVALVLVGALVSCGPAASDPPDAPGPSAETAAGSASDPTAAVAEVLDGYLSAIEERDTAAVRAAYVADARFAWIEDGSVRYRSADGVLEGLASFPPGTPLRTELDGLTVVPVGRDAAHAWTGFTTTVGAGEGAYSFGGVLSFVLERDGGAWRIVGGHTSSASSRR